MIEKPYLLFLAGARDRATAKTAVGVAHWRPDDCVGEIGYDGSLSLGLPRMRLDEAVAAGAKTIVVGVANAGGFLEPRWIETLQDALEAGLDVASGMHARLSDQPSLRAAADANGRRLHDLRKPPSDLKVGTGEPRGGRRVLTVGTDCSVGKMFTTLAIERELKARGALATFRATGQTGMLIAGAGICVDAVVADFISGATERLAPANDAEHIDVIEGQGSLSHPAFAGVSLGLLHGAQPDWLVVCHDPGHAHMRGAPAFPLPDIATTIALNELHARRTNPRARVVGLALNTRELDDRAAEDLLRRTADEHGLPAVDPVRVGAGPLADAILG